MDKLQDNDSKSLDVKIEDDKSSNNIITSRGAKRKRINSSSSIDGDDVLPDNTFDTEKNLQASAIKNNLDDVSVKKILKKVVTNDHVLALVKLREEEESGTTENLRPKLTRSKTKELMKVSPSSVSWPLKLTPIKHIPVNITPEVKALIAQELPEDEDDEEYEPSDDDHGQESCSDIDSQPRTPATPKSQKQPSSKVVQDGPFKVPQEVKTPVCRKLDLEKEEATIALRTRSKLSLSETPIEHIEESFVPPDDLPVPVVDDLWNEFLNECLNPASNVRNEDDDETDPEYNVAADPDANEEDESLENTILKISRKELNDLVTELFDVLPEGPVEPLQDIQNVLDQEKGFELNSQHWEGKREPISDEEHHPTSTNMAANIKMETRLSIGKTEAEESTELEQNTINNIIDVPMLVPISRPVKKTTRAEAQVPTRVILSVEETKEVRLPSKDVLSPPAPLKNLVINEPTTVEIEVDGNVKMNPEQILIYQQQLRQHIQLAASNFLQLYIHPTLWSHAPKYKEYLTSLSTAVNNNIAIVDVCNLKPAIELLQSWEHTLSENTKETKEMVKFLTKEVDKCRRRSAASAVHTGEFHDTFKKVVANSPVFLYPHLLPPVPYRSEFHHKRFSYLPSEDKLIVLGLDQFWRHIQSNPTVFRMKAHARGRGWLTEAARLTRACTLPSGLFTTRALLCHVQVARRAEDGVIHRYLKYNEIEPVKHKLFSFNPKITLYEQPELEMPRIWIKYLAKSSKRFKDYLYKRRGPTEPQGVEVELGKNINTNIEKAPLPIDFTKEILCKRLNVLPIAPKPTFVDKVDVPIEKTEQTATLQSSNIYTIINTSNGTLLVPIQVQTSTVNSTITPICTPLATDTTVDNRIDSNTQNDAASNKSNIYSNHCECCRMFKRIIKKQTLITDYFNSNTKRKEYCDCTNKKYPNISNKLKILINNFKRLSNVIYDELVNKIEECKADFISNKDLLVDGSSTKDFESAIKFQIKVVERCNIARHNLIKRSLNSIFNHFDVTNGDVFKLFKELFRVFGVELVDMYKELLGFLTPEQAEQMGVFKDYFVRNCVEDLMEKIEEQVPNREEKCKIFEVLKEIYLNNSLKSCDICCKLMECTQKFPELYKYIYSLFPHRRREIKDTCQQVPEIILNENKESQKEKVSDETTATMDYEADDSNSEKEEQEEEEIDEAKESDTPSSPRDISSPNRLVITIKSENGDTSEVIITEEEDSDNSSNMSTLAMSEDELKHEAPEWQRDEDKLILEVLKQYLTPEEIKDKTILEIIEEKNVINVLADSLMHKSLYDVKKRILYLLRMLIDNENSE